MDDILPSGQSVLERLSLDPASLKRIQPAQKRTHLRAALNWILKHKPQRDASNIEQTRGYIEAFHHFCEVEDWGKATALLTVRLNLPTQDEWHNQLALWGNYAEQVELYERLFGQLDSGWDSLCLNGLGHASFSQGDYDRALDYFQQELALAQKNEEARSEGKALSGIGKVYQKLGEYERAIECHQKHLEISRASGDREGENRALGNLSSTYLSIGDYPQAIDYLHQHLRIVEEIGNRELLGVILMMLGSAYFYLQDFDRVSLACFGFRIFFLSSPKASQICSYFEMETFSPRQKLLTVESAISRWTARSPWVKKPLRSSAIATAGR
ncbi:tetratricopeptide repeat protein [Synechococcus sp. PCC 7336]|uniref:tetratricopeptide repeat protein n=1 Tax=Synechococcus sp. PCC 7336 TaxID=195250 RepID=UPI00034D4877|nr:tetratricopeptide repeat protein [Synechococcus sp. PCC 7336]